VLETGLTSVADDGLCVTARTIGEAFSRKLFSDKLLGEPAVFFDPLIADRLKKVRLIVRNPPQCIPSRFVGTIPTDFEQPQQGHPGQRRVQIVRK
jgi:hypothetical protein